MAVHTRFYEILQVSTAASAEDIRKAYRQLSLRWHPDKHPQESREEATERFREVAEAYEVLSDAERRRIYDQYGEAGLRGEIPTTAHEGAYFGGFQFHSPFDIFREFFAHDPRMFGSMMDMSTPFASFAGHPQAQAGYSGTPRHSHHHHHQQQHQQQQHFHHHSHHPFHRAGSDPFAQLFGTSDPFANDPFFSQPLFSMGSMFAPTSSQSSGLLDRPHSAANAGQRATRTSSVALCGNASPDQHGSMRQNVTHFSVANGSAGNNVNSGSRIVSTQQSVRVVNGQRTVVTTTVCADGTETTVTELADGSQHTQTRTRGSQDSSAVTAGQPHHFMMHHSISGWPF